MKSSIFYKKDEEEVFDSELETDNDDLFEEDESYIDDLEDEDLDLDLEEIEEEL